ncbi:MAG: hypothetical protein WAM73_02350 [Desulfobacterales bacterium]
MKTAPGGDRPKRWLVIGLFWLIAAGCTSADVKTVRTGSAAGIDSILVLPFDDRSKIYGEAGLIKCPLCDYYFEAGPVPPTAAERLSERLVESLGSRTAATLITHDRSFDNSQASFGANRPTERMLLAQAGRSAGADAVLTGYIYRYQERIGTPYAASRPASVAFSIHLIRSADGGDLWFGYIDETQRTLAENLFDMAAFWKRKGRWVTADEMAHRGLSELLDNFPKTDGGG